MNSEEETLILNVLSDQMGRCKYELGCICGLSPYPGPQLNRIFTTIKVRMI